jgi:PAS domain S-box-containing protein
MTAERTTTGLFDEQGAVLNAVIEISDDAIVICGAQGEVRYWPRAAARLFGRAEAEMLGRPLENLWPDHLRAGASAVMARVLGGERITHFETEIQRPDGMPLVFSLSLCQVGAGAVVVARDVTEQRLAQARMAEVEERLEEGEALAHVGSWLWDVRTGAVQWSSEFHRIHGVDPMDFDGTFGSHLAAIQHDDRDRVRAAMKLSAESGRALDTEYRIQRPDGSVRSIRARAQATMGSDAGLARRRAPARRQPGPMIWSGWTATTRSGQLAEETWSCATTFSGS